MKKFALGIALTAGISMPAAACIGSEIFIVPVAVLVGILAFGMDHHASKVKDAGIAEEWRLLSLMVSAPFALLAGAGVLSLTTHAAQWRCSFAGNFWGQVMYHILLPLAAVCLGTALLRRIFSKQPVLEISFWAVLGLWATTFMALISAIVYDWDGKGSGHLPWRLLHYGTILMFCIFPPLMPWVGPNLSRSQKAGRMFLATGLLGCALGAFFRFVT